MSDGPDGRSTPLVAGNARVKAARRLGRRSERTERRRFLADGPKAVGAALEHDLVVEVFATPAAASRFAGLLAGAPTTLVDDRALASLSDSVSPAGVVAVCRLLDRDLADVVRPGTTLLAVCHEARDPGNAGTVVRTADAAGADGVVLTGDAVDLHNPKTLRASAGSAFHLPVAVAPDVAPVLAAARSAGLLVLAAAGDGEVDLEDPDVESGLLARPAAWLFGNEAHGLPDDVAAGADHRVRVPIRGRAESLNLATAAAVCLYASARARRRTRDRA